MHIKAYHMLSCFLITCISSSVSHKVSAIENQTIDSANTVIDNEMEYLINLPFKYLLNKNINVSSLLDSNILSTPATVHVLTESAIEQSTATTLTDALQKNIPGFYSMDQMWVNPLWGIRGIITDRGENMMLNVNGEMQNLVGRDGVVGDSMLGLMNDIRDVEVILGPGSVIHGMGALAGAVNVNLKDGRGEAPVQAKVSYGNFHDRSLEVARVFSSVDMNKVFRLSAGYRIADEPHGEWGGKQSGVSWSGGGYTELDHQHFGREIDDTYRMTAVFSDKKEKLRVWARYYDVEWYPGFHNSIANQGGQKFSRGYFHKNLSLSADKTIELTPAVSAKFTLGYTTANNGIMGGTNNIIYSSGERIDKGDIRESLTETRYRLRGDLKVNHFYNHPFALGVEYRIDDLGESWLGDHEMHPSEHSNNQVDDQPYEPAKYKNFGVFGEYRYTAFAVEPVVSFRYDKHTHNETFSPRVALMALSDDLHHSGRLVYQQAYRNHSGDFYEADRFVSEPNYNVDPATIKTLELGYYYSIENLLFSAVVFHNDVTLSVWENSIDRQQDTDYSTKGYEVGVKYRKDNFSVSLSHAQANLDDSPEQETIITPDNDHLQNYMEDVSRLQLSYQLKNWHFTLTGQYWWGLKARKKTDAWLAAHPEFETENNSTNLRDWDWVYSDSVKLDLNIQYRTKNVIYGLDLKNLLEPFDKSASFYHTFDANSDGIAASKAWTVDQFHARAYVKIFF